jgi:NAD(P)-dependent dehydrogenase (short-subunit alcohol dehydrogenase family)
MKSMTRTAVVTGGGRGIGAAIAIALARRGIQVAVSARSGRELQRTVDAIEVEGGRAVALTADLAERGEVEHLVVEAAQRLAPPDILVNNAGMAEAATIARTDDSLWDRHLAVNLTAAFWLCRALGPQMASRGWGRIVNVASATVENGLANTAAYSASKAGLVGLTRALAAELGPRGVTVNAVCPGFVETSLASAAIAAAPTDRSARGKRSAEPIRSDQMARGHQTRLLTSDEVAAVVAYLASEEAAAVNGQSVVVGS